MIKILIIDDDPALLEALSLLLRDRGHTIYTAATGEEGLESFYRDSPDIVFLDARLPDQDGLDILCQIQAEQRSAKVIIITGYHDMQTAIWALKNGAFEYLRKPWESGAIEAVIAQAWGVLQAEREKPLIEVFEKPALMEELIGESEPMLKIFKTIGLLARNRAPVLIEGDTGTGKDLIARIIHQFSDVSEQPFVVLDCSSVVETLIESELFGYEKGAFTGASRTQKGKIESAGAGTLFLDEIGELPLSLQGKFLGFLQRHEYMRVGGHAMQRSACRIIAATNRNLAKMVREGHFKEDLFYRLSVVRVAVPAMKERRTDIPLLVHHFIEKINQELHTGITNLQEGTIDLLMAHPWAGNVRELENTLVEACVRARGTVILVEDLERILARHQHIQHTAPSSEHLADLEKEHIQRILRHTRGNISETARRLNISRPTLRRKIQKYGIEP